MSDSDKPRKSWREIDKQRDRSTHRRDDRPKNGPQRGPRSQKSYRAALDRLFDSGKVGELVEQQAGPLDEGGEGSESRLKALRKIQQAEDPKTITSAVDAYLAAFELPDDPEILGKVLHHRDPGRQLDAMERLRELLPENKPKRTRAIVGQLKLIRDTSGDPELEQLASQLLDLLD